MEKLEHLSVSERSALEQLVKRLRDQLQDQIVDLQLFGSKSRGTYHEESDIDLLLVVRERTTAVLDIIAEISLEIAFQYDAHISIILFSSEEYNQNVAWETPFIKNVEKEGIPL